ncbi:tRNA pseudouridine(38-40) synthase [Neorickettsia helminthoeca str. Oregon]|uniref:tRNA pseudouridine synthase A n=1 Tax=Neorickettsia helminthoeca str. Oregon TaxID=1286528 RepID=X5HIY5_9RICK|nr:tRNA pseudouridine(38-40) synthase TruA [Neorickettsia helminthoeca]AHX10999.1 tRNA pseudouridine(38-40) synthase [Neorickettsia helminthoeca str. Oregon]
MRYKATIEYNGSEFSGWQRQKDARSIQGELEKILQLLFREEITITAAGRTDSGVHALGQVIHFDVEYPRLQPFQIMNAVNNHLRDSLIAITNVEIVDETFDARFSAKRRHYQYRIINRRAPLTIYRKLCWHLFQPLDFDLMLEQAKYLIGKHDFQSFRSAKCSASNALRTLDQFDIVKNGEEILFSISARSFLHNQVRIMVGTLVAIALGAQSSVPEILLKRNRCYAGPTAPAHGLYLVKIDY